MVVVVTDIVDSTRLWAWYEREMAADLVVHDDAVAKMIDLYGGRVFKRTGDGAMAVFDDPVEALTSGRFRIGAIRARVTH
jgi:class 3 adenylate cyclase